MADKKNMVQVEPKTRYKAYEIDMQMMIGKFTFPVNKDKNEIIEIPILEEDIFGSQNDDENINCQIMRLDCMALSQLCQAYPERNKGEIRDILFINGEDRWWNIKECKVKIRKGHFAWIKREEILKALITKGFLVRKEENEKGELYVKFEESASMSKNGCMTFIRKDVYDNMEKRITLGLQEPLYDGKKSEQDIITWQKDNNGPILAKWHAYKGLAMSSGWNVNELFERLYDKEKIQKKIDLNAESVIVIPDWGAEVNYPDCWTNIRPNKNAETEVKYEIKKMSEMNTEDWENYTGKQKDWVNYSDGEGFISEEFGAYLEQLLRQVEKERVTGCLSSFQIRLPFIKGMVHRVDFKKYFHENNIAKIKDSYEVKHDVDKIQMILTESMFKACEWLGIKFGKKNKEAWQYYWDQIREYNHSLYISEKNATTEIIDKDTDTDLNYQIIHTVGFSEDAIMQLAHDSLKYKKKCENDELEKLDFEQDKDDDFYDEKDDSLQDNEEKEKKSSNDWIQMAVKENSEFRETAWVKEEFKNVSNKRVKEFQKGHLSVKGTTRYLSTDLFGLMQYIGSNLGYKWNGEKVEIKPQTTLRKYQFFTPGCENLNSKQNYGISRNPHIARNEHVMLKPLPVGKKDKVSKELQHYEEYFGKLTGVLMISPASLVAQRMGGADYDGDKVRLINNKIYNTTLENKIIDPISEKMKLPLIRIEPAAPSKDEWSNQYRQKEYELYRAINECRVGKFSNLAFKLGCLAYGFCEDEAYKKKTLDFTVYTGLELDAVKSGVRPKINEDDYKKIKNDNPFLQMKDGQSMGKISYYKDLDNKVRETKTEMDVSTDQTNPIEKESIKRALKSMPKDLQSAVVLLPYYVKEENKKINKSDKAEKQKNLETYIFDRLYKEIKKEAKSNVLDEEDDVDANKENALSEKISKVKMVCDAIACLQKGLSGANQYVSCANRHREFMYENNGPANETSKILYKQHSAEIAEKKLKVLDEYVENINMTELEMKEISDAIENLLNRHFELISNEDERKELIIEKFKTIDKANGKYNLNDCNGELVGILCDFSFGGYQIAYRVLKSLRQQKESKIREQLKNLFDEDEENDISNIKKYPDNKMWNYIKKCADKRNRELEESMENDGEWREKINIEEDARAEILNIAKSIIKASRKKPKKFSDDPEAYLSKMTEEKFEELTGYYKGVLSQIKQTADREQKARELLEKVIAELKIDGDNLVLRTVLEYWHRQDSKAGQRKAEHFLWQVAGEEIIKMARKLEVEHA